MERGYENTTMRMISEETGFGAGSLYNTFDGKEDILKDIILAAYEVIIQKVKTYLTSDVDPLVAISFPMCTVLYSASVNKRYAELFKVAHHTWSVLNAMVDRSVELDSDYIGDFNVDITEEELKRKLMIVAAVMGRYIFEYSENESIDCTEGIYMCLFTYCTQLGLPTDDLESVVDSTLALFKDEMVFGAFDVKPNNE